MGTDHHVGWCSIITITLVAGKYASLLIIYSICFIGNSLDSLLTPVIITSGLHCSHCCAAYWSQGQQERTLACGTRGTHFMCTSPITDYKSLAQQDIDGGGVQQIVTVCWKIAWWHQPLRYVH